MNENEFGQPLEESQEPEPTYDVTVGGETQSVPLSELLKGYSRTADYTRKTQALSERERQYQGRIGEYEAALGEIANLLDNEELLKQYIAKRFAQAQQVQQQGQPPQQLTMEQIQQLLAQQQQATQGQMQQLYTTIQTQQLANEYGQQINAKLATLKQQHPSVFFRPGMERLIREEVQQMGPTNVAEALKAFETVVQGYAKDLAKQGTTAAQLRSIEPPGGSPAMPKSEDDFGDIRDPRLRQKVIEDILAGKTL